MWHKNKQYAHTHTDFLFAFSYIFALCCFALSRIFVCVFICVCIIYAYIKHIHVLCIYIYILWRFICLSIWNKMVKQTHMCFPKLKKEQKFFKKSVNISGKMEKKKTTLNSLNRTRALEIRLIDLFGVWLYHVMARYLVQDTLVFLISLPAKWDNNVFFQDSWRLNGRNVC